MSNYYEPMNDKFAHKKLSDGQIFKLWAKNNKNTGVAGAVSFAVIGLFFVPSLLTSIFGVIEGITGGNKEDLVMDAVFGVIMLLIVVGLAFLSRWAWRRGRVTVEKILERDAAHNSLSEGELLEFERQALQQDSTILHFDMQDGVATKDYLWLGNQAVPQTILRRSDIIAMAPVRRENVVANKRSYTTFLYVISRQGDTLDAGGLVTVGYYQAPKPVVQTADGSRKYKGLVAFAPAGGEEPARKFMEFLAKDRPDIVLSERLLMAGEDFDQWYEKLWEELET